MPDLDETDLATRRVLDLVQAACDSWRFPGNLNHAMATAALRRVADLLDEALQLVDRSSSVGSNILVRSAFECWLVGVYALFGGDDALLGIEHERARNEKALADRVCLPQEAVDYVADQQSEIKALSHQLLGSDIPSSVKVNQIAEILPRLIREQTPDQEEVDMLAAYDLLYRSHSTYDAHPWWVLGQYVCESGLGMKVVSCGPWLEPIISTANMAMYLGLLGRWIEVARGGDGSSWNDVVSDLQQILASP